jgi:hypothetical protein
MCQYADFASETVSFSAWQQHLNKMGWQEGKRLEKPVHFFPKRIIVNPGLKYNWKE